MAKNAPKQAAEKAPIKEQAQPDQPKDFTLKDSLVACTDHLGGVMSMTGKRPGDLVALQAEMQRIIKQDHPLLSRPI